MQLVKGTRVKAGPVDILLDQRPGATPPKTGLDQPHQITPPKQGGGRWPA